MRMRSCFLYTVAFVFVATVCAIIAASTITGGNRNASVDRLEELVARYAPPPAAPADPTAPVDAAAGSAPASPATSSAPEAFAEVRKVVESSGTQPDWQGVMELYQGDVPPAEWTDGQWAELAAFVGSNADLLAEIRRIAATDGPLVELPKPLNYDTGLEHLAPARQMARLLAMDTLVAARRGDMDRALVNLEAGLGLARATARDQILISSLVDIAITGIAHHAIRDGIAPGSLDGAQTRELVNALARSYPNEAYTAALATEAAMGRSIFDGIRTGEMPPGIESQGQGDELISTVYGSVLMRPLLNLDEGAQADALARLIEASTLPYYEAREDIRQLEEELAGGLPFLKPITRITTPAIGQTLEAQARGQATVDLMRLGLLLELEYAETGRYPDSLDAVADGMGGSVPLDPYTGEPYRYIPQGDAFQLYSLYVNGTDDGGVGERREGDLAWRGDI